MSESSRSAVQRAADDNMIESFRVLVPHLPAPAAVGVFGEAVAIVTGIASPFFNPVLGVGDAPAEADLRAAVDFSIQRGVRPSIEVRSDLHEPAARLAHELGFEREDPDMPGMVLDPLPTTIPAVPPELRIVPVADAPSVDAWVTAAGGLGAVIPRGFLVDPLIRAVVGLVDGVPVTHAFATATDGAIGLYAVGTVEDARRRGYGAAITWAAIRAGREAWGDRPVILQSSELGLPVYRRMGFREICRYAIWFPPKRAEPVRTRHRGSG
jgi:GNAT superfamily N-acetyltransferase